MPKNNSAARRTERQERAADRLARSKPCPCGSVHVDGHKGGLR